MTGTTGGWCIASRQHPERSRHTERPLTGPLFIAFPLEVELVRDLDDSQQPGREVPAPGVAVAMLEAGQFLGGTWPGQRNGLSGTPGNPAKAGAKHWPQGWADQGRWLGSSSGCRKGPGGQSRQRPQAVRAVLQPRLC